ncbi:VWA domain-containing protein [Myxococcus sp. AM011]|uniref:vWA domain-containing protein n=1 Tax=Myxococcus sp. AM011 TaxID=2745200 RepID=UPI0015953AFE|nr:VWA domain-containing protein [Myxococcus sp. AM011]NVJ26071.1 VWA domain-containing protein [Myxococcus sp. AM011]
MTRNTMLQRLLLMLGLSLVLHSESARAQFTERHIIILIERSGSMAVVGADGLTRFQRAIIQAQNRVEIGGPLPQHYAVWSFEGTSYIQHQAFTSSAASTIATLSSLQVGQGGTPLAHAVCAAVDGLVSYRPSTLAIKNILLFTGGAENSTPSSSQCAGPWSTGTYPQLTVGSWQWKMINKLRTGSALNPNVPPPGLTLIHNAQEVISSALGSGVIIP